MLKHCLSVTTDVHPGQSIRRMQEGCLALQYIDEIFVALPCRPLAGLEIIFDQ